MNTSTKKEYTYTNWLAEFGPISERDKITPERREQADKKFRQHLESSNGSDTFIGKEEASKDDIYSSFYHDGPFDTRYTMYCYENLEEQKKDSLVWNVEFESLANFLDRVKENLSNYTHSSYGDYLESNSYGPDMTSFTDDETKEIASEQLKRQGDIGSRAVMNFNNDKKKTWAGSPYYSERLKNLKFIKWSHNEPIPTDEAFDTDEFDTLKDAIQHYWEEAEAAAELNNDYLEYLCVIKYDPDVLFGVGNWGL